MLSRRDFVKWSAAAGAWVYTSGLGASRFMEKAFAAIPGGTLDPSGVPKFATPLLIPPVMPRAAQLKSKGGKPVDYYEISMKQITQQILPAGLPATTVWGYGAVAGMGKNPLLVHNAPSLTIEAQGGRAGPHQVDQRPQGRQRQLPAASASRRPDASLGEPAWGDRGTRHATHVRPRRPEPTQGRFRWFPTCTVRWALATRATATRRHGSCPPRTTFPATTRSTAPGTTSSRARRWGSTALTWGPGYATFEYPNANRASTIWYHDHALGMTRLNVYAGPAGFFIIRGGPAGDKAVLDTRTGLSAVLPGPAPKEGDKFPSNKAYYEIPIAIQDRAFNTDGSLFYPDSRTFFDGIAGPYIPEGMDMHGSFSPIWNPEFFGNTIMVNGNTWPFLNVEQRRYRFRFLNGCQSRFLILDFAAIPGVEVWQIGNEGGFLAAPVNVTALGNQQLLGLAERADMIVDFTNVPAGQYVLGNLGPDEPFGGGIPNVDFAGC